MGLDMYLKGKLYVSDYCEPKYEVQVAPDVLSPFKIKGIQVELMYWRKANAIHKWFVENVQGGEDDCDEYYVDTENLTALAKVVANVLENPDMASELLPCENGFFFGSTNYDPYYFKELKDTKEALTKIFESGILDKVSVYYQSSW